MKKFLLVLPIAVFILGSCRDQANERPVETTHTKEVIHEVHVETKEEPKRDGILERTGKKIDRKVNSKIDEKIDKID